MGGGPAGLYFAILMRKAFPDSRIRVLERNRADDTFGWGVVFSDETLGAFEDADPESYAEITANFKYWRDIETHHAGECVISTGHGFAALSRKKLLLILQRRCRELGVELEFEREVENVAEFADADLIVASDGVNSAIRETYSEHFGAKVDWRKCRFCWLGTDKPLGAFTFVFKDTPHGLFQVHAYPFESGEAGAAGETGLGTWIVECREEVWRRAGLDRASEDDTVAFCQELFAEYLAGHKLLTNRSLWRSFPTVHCDTWHRGNLVLLGDAAHTAHFSIGSGTKLAMEDAIQLTDSFRRLGIVDIPAALAHYEESRWVDVVKLQKAAQTSLEWFENSERYKTQSPIQFTFNLMTRSKRITYDNLRQRDPVLIGRLDEWYRQDAGAPAPLDGKAPAPIFTPYKLRGLELVNRIVVSPMCQYSAVDGVPNDWHLVHLGNRAIGGAGLIITEMTDVAAEGRITLGCAGLYKREHVDAWARIVDFVHANSDAKIGVQLAHAGRKGSVRHPWLGDDVPLTAAAGAWETIAPSANPFQPDWPAPRAMVQADMEAVARAFVRSTQYASEAGFDLIEVHMAHGYLLSSFISPLSNRRQDEYGGSLENRMRFPLEVFRSMRAVWPEDKPMSVRISASDWMADGSGITAAESVEIAKLLSRSGCDLLDVSSGGNVPESRVEYGRMYQVPFADRIRHETGMPIAAVGALLGADHANTVLAAGRADLAVMARPHLRDAYLTLHAAERYGYWQQKWPGQYQPGKPVPPRPKRRRR
ncbi:MAG: bifunctional salicylyl-CoA 5-hydroxylase/oxidoreductase [bacterium]|nr:bifunctional salicylyl-CoA 5-hydroxylase/oxidoreductase [bacterium]